MKLYICGNSKKLGLSQKPGISTQIKYCIAFLMQYTSRDSCFKEEELQNTENP